MHSNSHWNKRRKDPTCQVPRPVHRKERWSVTTHFHNIKVSDSFLGAHWLQRRNTPCEQSQCLCKLGLQKNMPPSSLEKWLKKKKNGCFQIWGRENTSWTWKNSVFYCALKKEIKESWRHVKATQLEGALLVKSWQFMNQNDSNGCEPTKTPRV